MSDTINSIGGKDKKEAIAALDSEGRIYLAERLKFRLAGEFNAKLGALRAGLERFADTPEREKVVKEFIARITDWKMDVARISKMAGRQSRRALLNSLEFNSSILSEINRFEDSVNSRLDYAYNRLELLGVKIGQRDRFSHDRIVRQVIDGACKETIGKGREKSGMLVDGAKEIRQKIKETKINKPSDIEASLIRHAKTQSQ